MSVDYTTVGLIANTRRRASLPEGSGFTDNDFLQVLSEQLRNYIPAFLKGIREEFIIAQASATVTAATVPIPTRACGAALRTIAWTMSDGTLRDLARIEPERRNDYGSSTGEPVGYVFQGNNIILVPAAIYFTRRELISLTQTAAQRAGLVEIHVGDDPAVSVSPAGMPPPTAPRA